MENSVNTGNAIGIFRALFTEGSFFLLACLLCGLPVFLPHFPPMVDLPQHAAQISLFFNLDKPGFPFSNEFHLNLFTPYLLGYSLIAAFSPLLGVLVASKLVVWLALAAFALSSRFLLRSVGADHYWSWLTFPVLYGFTYQWGLLSFLIAAPVGIFFLGLVWRLENKPSLRSSLFVAIMLYVLFFCHALIMAFFSLMVVVYWMHSTRKISVFIKRAWPMATLIPLVLPWLFLASKHPLNSSVIEWDLSWGRTTDLYYAHFASWTDHKWAGMGRVTGFVPRLLGVRPSLAVMLLGILLFALPFLAGGRLTKSSVRYIPLLSIGLFLLIFPGSIFGNAYNFQRFTFLAMPLYLVMIDTVRNPLRIQCYLRLLAPAFAFGWIVFMSFNALQFDKDSDGFEAVTSLMEPNKRAMSLIFSKDDSHSIAPTFLHYPAWYSGLKDGVVNPSFAVNYVQPVVYDPKYLPREYFRSFEWNPNWFNWEIHEGDKYDYFVVHSSVDRSALIFKTALSKVELSTHSGDWWLYKRVHG